MKKLINKIVCIILGIMLVITTVCCGGAPGESGNNDGSQSQSQSQSQIDTGSESDTGSDSGESTPDEGEQFVILNRLEGADVNLNADEFDAYLSLTTEHDKAKFLQDDYNQYHDITKEKREAVASKTMTFSWQDNTPGVSYYSLKISDKADFSNVVFSKTFFAPISSYELTSFLNPGTYYYKLKDNLGNETQVDSFNLLPYVRSFVGGGISNMRDLGGWATEDGKRIKYGVAYRSGEYTSAAACGQFLKSLGMKYEIDLRRNKSDEPPHNVSMIDASYGINFLWAPIKQCDFVLKDKGYYNALTEQQIAGLTTVGYYKDGTLKTPYVDDYGTSLKKAFKLFTDSSNFPVVFHCTSGADRTGTFAFLLEGLLGVSLEDAYRDYELTSITMQGMRWRSNIVNNDGVYSFTDDGFVTRTGNYIAIGLLYQGLMYTYNPVDGKFSTAVKMYLKDVVGLTDADIEAIINNLTE